MKVMVSLPRENEDILVWTARFELSHHPLTLEIVIEIVEIMYDMF